MLDVELCLYALIQCAPKEAAADGWALMSGYDLRAPTSRVGGIPPGLPWLLNHLKSERDFSAALNEYQAIDARLRLYEVPGVDKPPVRRPALSVGIDRENVYAQALAALPEHKSDDTALADVGTRYRLGRTDAAVTIPEGLRPSHGSQHQPTRQRRAVALTWKDLQATASHMDTVDASAGLDSRQWRHRLDDMELHVRRNGQLRRGNHLDLRELVHVVGMPAVGKTTLITVASVWAAGQGLHFTVVLGDVISVLNMVRDLNHYQSGAAAPILGAANRGRHLQQLHRPGRQTAHGLPLLNDDRLRWLSTSCLVHGLIDNARPRNLTDIACSSFHPWNEDKDRWDERQRLACPLLSACGWHEASRELVTAPIWVATAPSLLHCRVPTQLSDAAMRYLELAWLRSDVFLVDEADRVQVQWDEAFSPSQTLSGPSQEAWLEEIGPIFRDHMRHTHGQHLTSGSVRSWSINLESASQLLSRLRALMAAHPYVRDWLASKGYFNEWVLGVRLAHQIATRPNPHAASSANQPQEIVDDPIRQRWLDVFAAWTRKPTGDDNDVDERVAFLRSIAARGYDEPDTITHRLRDWLQKQPDVNQSSYDADGLAVRFHVVIVVALLAAKLNALTQACWEVAVETNVDRLSSSHLVHRPPPEYLPLVPDAPMGNLLGFQYRERQPDTPSDELGTLSFFRCSGIGRWLLLNLPNLYGPPGSGPAALLLSATSWAGTSPRYDVQAPVTAVLTSQKSRSVSVPITLQYLPTTTTDAQGQSVDVRVSGRQGPERARAITTILQDLSKQRGGLHGPSPSRLEAIRDSLSRGRRRLLLLVGSYDEAHDALHELLQLRPDWDGQILRMIPDDGTGTHTWNTHTLARGTVYALAEHQDVWLLIAPQLAIERGHNILNDQQVSALGAAFYLVRPHLHPEDLRACLTWCVGVV